MLVLEIVGVAVATISCGSGGRAEVATTQLERGSLPVWERVMCGLVAGHVGGGGFGETERLVVASWARALASLRAWRRRCPGLRVLES